jgi:diguanylate cyclase (GGDEF)-like protein
MTTAPTPHNETARLAELEALDILDTLPEQAYDDITYLASRLCETPIALVSLVDGQRQWFKSRVGIDAAETPRSMAFCAHAIVEPGGLFVVENALDDPRFANNPLVTDDPSVRFYAGAPLVTKAGNALGTLCVVDTEPRQLSEDEARALEALSRQVMAQLELRRVVDQLESSQIELSRLSVTDSLTSLLNRRAFEATLTAEIARHQRYGHELALALIDVDGFKGYNDSLGHVAGDKALQAVARVLKEVCRKTDVAVRYGGDEFALILPETEHRGAWNIAERFRRGVERLPWPQRSLSVSVGVAMAGAEASTSQALIELADTALYRAKAAGRNQVA